MQAGESCNYQTYLYGPSNLGPASLNISMGFKDANGKEHDLAASTRTDVIAGDYITKMDSVYKTWVEFLLNVQGNPTYGNLWKAGDYKFQVCYPGLGSCYPDTFNDYCNVHVTDTGQITASYVDGAGVNGYCAVHIDQHSGPNDPKQIVVGYDITC